MAKLQELAGAKLQVKVYPDADHGFSCKDSAKYKKKVKIASAAICATECDKKKQCGGFHFMPHKKNEKKNKCQMFKAKAGASTRPCPSKSTCCMSNSG